VAPAGELGEQQGAIPRFHHFFENLLKPLQLRRTAGEIGAHLLFPQQQRRVVANLLELGEQSQHLAVPLAERCPLDRLQGVVDSLAIQLGLLAAELHPFGELQLFRQIGNDRFVAFQAPEDEGADAGFEVLERGGVAIALNR